MRDHQAYPMCQRRPIPASRPPNGGRPASPSQLRSVSDAMNVRFLAGVLLAAIDAYESLDTFYEECGGETLVTVIDGVEHTRIQSSHTNCAKPVTSRAENPRMCSGT
jgi:hypothetical protein